MAGDLPVQCQDTSTPTPRPCERSQDVSRCGEEGQEAGRTPDTPVVCPLCCPSALQKMTSSAVPRDDVEVAGREPHGPAHAYMHYLLSLSKYHHCAHFRYGKQRLRAPLACSGSLRTGELNLSSQCPFSSIQS